MGTVAMLSFDLQFTSAPLRVQGSALLAGGEINANQLLNSFRAAGDAHFGFEGFELG